MNEQEDVEETVAELLGLHAEMAGWETVEMDDDWWFFHEPTPYDDTPPLDEK